MTMMLAGWRPAFRWIRLLAAALLLGATPAVGGPFLHRDARPGELDPPTKVSRSKTPRPVQLLFTFQTLRRAEHARDQFCQGAGRAPRCAGSGLFSVIGQTPVAERRRAERDHQQHPASRRRRTRLPDGLTFGLGRDDGDRLL